MSDIRIETLSPLRLACANAISRTPEEDAWRKLTAWAQDKGLLDSTPRFFGYNNPSPSAEGEEYGYDACIVVDDRILADDTVRIRSLPGGLYAVLPIAASSGEDIVRGWQRLNTWCADSPYRIGDHQWLEEHFLPVWMRFALYLPLVEK